MSYTIDELHNNHTDPKAITRIKKLPECIQPHVELNDPCWSYCPQGWQSLVEELHNNLVKIHPDYTIRQVKEKFGGLRFYTNIKYDSNDPALLLVEESERRSHTICDVCGNAGTKRHIDGCFIATRCEDHSSRDDRRAKVTEHDR